MRWRIAIVIVAVILTATQLVFGSGGRLGSGIPVSIEREVVQSPKPQPQPQPQPQPIKQTSAVASVDILEGPSPVLSDRWMQLSQATRIFDLNASSVTSDYTSCMSPAKGPSTSAKTDICITLSQIRFTISDTKGCVNHPDKVTNDKQYASLLRKEGPSSFRIRFISFEEVIIPTLTSFIEDNCTYVFSAVARKASTFIIEAEIWYRHYLAFEEKKSETPPMARELLFQPNETMTKKGKAIEGAQHLSPDRNLYHFSHPVHGKPLRSGKFRASKNYIWDQYTLSTADTFTCLHSAPLVRDPQRCQRENTGITLQPGSWIATSNADELPEEQAHTHFERYFPTRLYQWSPNYCSLPKFTPTAVRQCLSEKQLVFTGDSHMRVLFTYIANLMVEKPEDMMDPEVKRMEGMTISLGRNTTLRLINDIYLEKHSLEKLSNTNDVVVAGFGSWCLGGGGKNPDGRVVEDVGRWSFRKYASRVSDIARDWSKSTSSSSKYWLNMPAYPPNQRRFSKLKGEYRTTHRIRHLNTAAEQQMLSYNIPIIDIFSPSNAMIHTSLDHNHFLGYVQDAAVHQFLNLVCH